MNIAVLGGFGKRWTRQVAVAFLGGGQVDLTHVAHREHARLTAIAVLGGLDVIVDEGTHVTMTGFSILGGRDKVNVAAGDGPAVRVRAIALLGGVNVRTHETQPPVPG